MELTATSLSTREHASPAGGDAVASLRYQTGFGNEFASEALPRALPRGRSTPQRVAYGLYTEGVSGTSFTAPRAANRRAMLYRIRPSVVSKPFRRIDTGLLRTAPLPGAWAPNPLRWSQFKIPTAQADFVQGLFTLAANGDPALQVGMAVHMYGANRSMVDRAFFNADGELLVVPQEGRLKVITELGMLSVGPREFILIPRGLRFRVELLDGVARGYVCENYGAPFRLPELGLIGTNGLANARDFLAPVAAFEDREHRYELVGKASGGLWVAEMDHSPFDVVAWHGNSVPYKYDLSNFMTINSVSFDHPDPSIYTVLTSPSDTPGTANVDFAALTPRWMVAEDTFRPPYFHRNVMSEFLGLVSGVHEAKVGGEGGFVPGGASLHNPWTAHGPDAITTESALSAPLIPQKFADSYAVMFESRYPLMLTDSALERDELQEDYFECWQQLPKRFSSDA